MTFYAKPLRVEKGWGYELIFANTPEYCGKILHFNSGKKTSMHFHVKKTETFYVYSGEFIIRSINTKDASKSEQHLTVGMDYEVPSYLPHQIESIVGGDIFEASTNDDPCDSYRVERGTSQENNIKNPHPSRMGVPYTNVQVTPIIEGDFTLQSTPSPRQFQVFSYMHGN
jgi:mannose-6-phosphate isomerase-like protein (cupin superfamily)